MIFLHVAQQTLTCAFLAQGPGNYSHDSMFSKQKSSLKQSSENFKFGSSARDDIAKVRLLGVMSQAPKY